MVRPAGSWSVRSTREPVARSWLASPGRPEPARARWWIDSSPRFGARGAKVGVIAVDPTSPFSGGAVLGDRVRMNAHAADDGVFIRSMATRGHLGGLARATSDAALVLDAAGTEVVIIETVGVGQDEVDIVSTADVSIVLLVPGTGDDLQAIKAGVMEIGDIFVVNKADREGADRVVQGVASNLSLKTYGASEWKPPIVKTEATTGGGVEDLWKEIGRFREWASAQRHERRRQRHVSRLREMLAASFLGTWTVCSLPVTSIAWSRRLATGATRSILSSRRDHESRVAPMKAVLDHIGIAVQDIEKAIAFYGDALGLEVQAPEEVVSERVRARSMPVGGPSLELLEATAPDSAIATYIGKRGPGLHHVTLRVDDLRAALAHLKARGVRLINAEPRPGAEGSLVAFIHPSAAHGVLVELKQRAEPDVRLDGQAAVVRRSAADGPPRRSLQTRWRGDVRCRASPAVGEAGAARRAESHPARDAAACSSRRRGAG